MSLSAAQLAAAKQQIAVAKVAAATELIAAVSGPHGQALSAALAKALGVFDETDLIHQQAHNLAHVLALAPGNIRAQLAPLEAAAKA